MHIFLEEFAILKFIIIFKTCFGNMIVHFQVKTKNLLMKSCFEKTRLRKKAKFSKKKKNLVRANLNNYQSKFFQISIEWA